MAGGKGVQREVGKSERLRGWAIDVEESLLDMAEGVFIPHIARSKVVVIGRRRHASDASTAIRPAATVEQAWFLLTWPAPQIECLAVFDWLSRRTCGGVVSSAAQTRIPYYMRRVARGMHAHPIRIRCAYLI